MFSIACIFYGRVYDGIGPNGVFFIGRHIESAWYCAVIDVVDSSKLFIEARTLHIQECACMQHVPPAWFCRPSAHESLTSAVICHHLTSSPFHETDLQILA